MDKFTAAVITCSTLFFVLTCCLSLSIELLQGFGKGELWLYIAYIHVCIYAAVSFPTTYTNELCILSYHCLLMTLTSADHTVVHRKWACNTLWFQQCEHRAL